MAKVTGLVCAVTVDDNGGTPRTISNDVTNFDLSVTRGVIETTGVDKSAMERLLGLADASVTLNGIPNFATNQQHDVFKTVTSGSALRTTAVALASAAATLTFEALYNSYTLARDDGAKATWQAQGSLADGNAPVWS